MLGSSFAGYEILERLGGGNTGIVYRARDTGTHQVVALKVLPNDLLLSEEKNARFQREFQAAIMLDHESIAKPIQIGEYHQCQFFAMEFIEGMSFRRIIDQNPDGLDLRNFEQLILPVLEGIAYAHHLNVVHRDLKPENLLLGRDGHPKILDFGLVKFLDDDSKDSGFKTMAGRVLGSANYMSPEQVEGGVIDARTDIFSLGILMYEMLSGANPFRTKSPFHTMQKIIKDNPMSIELVQARVPQKLGKVIAKCLSKHAQDRYRHGSDLLEAFSNYVG